MPTPESFTGNFYQTFFLNFLFCILRYNVVILSGKEWRDSLAIRIPVPILPQAHPGWHITLSRKLYQTLKKRSFQCYLFQEMKTQTTSKFFLWNSKSDIKIWRIVINNNKYLQFFRSIIFCVCVCGCINNSMTQWTPFQEYQDGSILRILRKLLTNRKLKEIDLLY